MDGNRYAAHTAGSVSGNPTLSPAGEGIDGNRYAEHTAGSVSVGPTLAPAGDGQTIVRIDGPTLFLAVEDLAGVETRLALGDR